MGVTIFLQNREEVSVALSLWPSKVTYEVPADWYLVINGDTGDASLSPVMPQLGGA